MTPGWSVSEALGDRIRALVSAKTELSNHLHFARLFQSQLIAVRIWPPLRKHCLIALFLIKIKINFLIGKKNLELGTFFHQPIRKWQPNNFFKVLF